MLDELAAELRTAQFRCLDVGCPRSGKYRSHPKEPSMQNMFDLINAYLFRREVWVEVDVLF